MWNASVKCLEESDILKKKGGGTITENFTVDRYQIKRAKEAFAKKQKEKEKEKNTKEGIECIGTDGNKTRRL